jgi:hypothetical protein
VNHDLPTGEECIENGARNRMRSRSRVAVSQEGGFQIPLGQEEVFHVEQVLRDEKDFLEGGQAFNIKLIGSTWSISGASGSARGVARAGHPRNAGFASAHVVEKT